MFGLTSVISETSPILKYSFSGICVMRGLLRLRSISPYLFTARTQGVQALLCPFSFPALRHAPGSPRRRRSGGRLVFRSVYRLFQELARLEGHNPALLYRYLGARLRVA